MRRRYKKMADVKVGDLIYYQDIPSWGGGWKVGLVIQYYPAKSKRRSVAERSICYIILVGDQKFWLSFEELNWESEGNNVPNI